MIAKISTLLERFLNDFILKMIQITKTLFLTFQIQINVIPTFLQKVNILLTFNRILNILKEKSLFLLLTLANVPPPSRLCDSSITCLNESWQTLRRRVVSVVKCSWQSVVVETICPSLAHQHCSACRGPVKRRHKATSAAAVAAGGVHLLRVCTKLIPLKCLQSRPVPSQSYLRNAAGGFGLSVHSTTSTAFERNDGSANFHFPSLHIC